MRSVQWCLPAIINLPQWGGGMNQQAPLVASKLLVMLHSRAFEWEKYTAEPTNAPSCVNTKGHLLALKKGLSPRIEHRLLT